MYRYYISKYINKQIQMPVILRSKGVGTAVYRVIDIATFIVRIEHSYRNKNFQYDLASRLVDLSAKNEKVHVP